MCYFNTTFVIVWTQLSPSLPPYIYLYIIIYMFIKYIRKYRFVDKILNGTSICRWKRHALGPGIHMDHSAPNVQF